MAYKSLRQIALATCFAVGASTASLAQVEEVVVTGSLIKQTPGDTALPVDVINTEDLQALGSPSVVELVRNLGVSSGFDGETNQFQSNGLNGTANINLRGLGAGRNLVLMNGARMPFSPYAISEQQQLFVDINAIPAIALSRLEILKDGAAATYGSDAISGVVNFITRADFEGLEMSLAHKVIADGDGDTDFGVIGGGKYGKTHIVASLGYNKRGEVAAKDRDWAIQPYATNQNTQGWTGIPNVGSFIDWNTLSTQGATPAIVGAITDPECENFIGTESLNGRDPYSPFKCTYNYVYFDNIAEEEERMSFFSELTHDFSDTMQLSAELLYANADVPSWKTSPSYPPQTLVDTSLATGRFIPSYHPALGQMQADYPSAGFTGYDANCSVTGRTDRSCDRYLFFGRPFGVVGPANEGSRTRETMRLAVALEGAMRGLDYRLALTSGTANGENKSPDTYSERWALALRGFGGPNCAADETTPGANDCEFYNPFSNAIRVPQQKYAKITENPNYDADLANSSALQEWMKFDLGSENDTTLTVFDALVNGSGDWLGGFDWAAGLQLRSESYKLAPFDPNNMDLNPCRTAAENERFRATGEKFDSSKKQCDNGTTTGATPTSDDYIGAGQFIFLAGSTPFDESQDISALFGEIRADLTSRLEAQFSLRYEDYGGKVSNSVDPKLGLRFEATENLVVRGSASTTFRGPTLNQLGGQTTTLSFVPQASTFKAVDTDGTPDLDPETAQTLNIGLVYDVDDFIGNGDNFFVSFDYWSIAFSDPIIKESFGDIIAAVCGTRAADSCDTNHALYGRLDIATRGQARDVQRIRTKMINGPDIDTNGIDFELRYAHDAMAGRMQYGLSLNRVLSYDVGKGELNEAFDALGKTNESVAYLRSVVEDRASLNLGYMGGAHRVNLIANHIGSYKDGAADVPTGQNAADFPREIEAHTTFDLTYTLALNMMNMSNTDVSVNIFNLTDEDPPFARLDMNYDPYTHNPFGRMVKLGLRHKF